MLLNSRKVRTLVLSYHIIEDLSIHNSIKKVDLDIKIGNY